MPASCKGVNMAASDGALPSGGLRNPGERKKRDKEKKALVCTSSKALLYSPIVA